MKLNWVIGQNSVRPCVKGECDVCACAKSRDLSVGGRKQLHFWNLRPRYAYSLYNFYRASFDVFCVKIRAGVLAVDDLTNRKNEHSRVNNLMREIAHAQKRNPLSDLDEILHNGRYPRRNHVGKFWWRSVKGFMGGGGSNFGLSHWHWSSSLQHSRTTVRVCDISLYLRNGVRLGNSYGTLVGNYMNSIKWRYFHWLWLIHNYPQAIIISIFCIAFHIFISELS